MDVTANGSASSELVHPATRRERIETIALTIYSVNEGLYGIGDREVFHWSTVYLSAFRYLEVVATVKT